MHRRALRDQLATVLVSAGGICVIMAVVLICIFLVYIVLPLFGSADTEVYGEYKVAEAGESQYLAIDEYLEKAVNINTDGQVQVFNGRTGEIDTSFSLVTNSHQLTAHDVLLPVDEVLFFGLDNGQLLPVKINYDVSYPEDRRHTDVTAIYPYGEALLDTGLANQPIELLAVREGNDTLLAATWQKTSGLHLLEYEQESSFLDGSIELSLTRKVMVGVLSEASWIGIDSLYSWLYVVDDQKNQIHFYDIRDLDSIQLVHSLDLVDYGSISKVAFLTGNLSLLIGFDSGRLVQAFPVRRKDDSSAYRLQVVRELPAMQDSVTSIHTEYTRKGFAASDQRGHLGIYYSTNAEKLAEISLPEELAKAGFAPRENAILTRSVSGTFRLIRIDNPYPEVSFASLWSELWYEGYEEADYVWQSSSSSNDFEPKFSLTPLTFGTIKAAFYAMLVATPLAIMAAIYTAFFLSPALRQWIKPIIEIMEALPTVILGFLAGLWLAPFMEQYLTFIFLLLLIVPFGVIALGYGTSRITYVNASNNLLHRMLSEEWRVLILFPSILLLSYLCWLIQTPLENLFFNGNMRYWISNDLGISFDQRNALVIGTVMGFAVIPTIFSITEDAVFAVPNHLVNGSLALGASNWQTLAGVVLPTASPGIFSAVMIGMGRAVGETMIVLMATGNTPVMDFSVFEGMRTLSANIAVEMPEAEVGSSHYRILFLAGLVLFIFTFFFNTLGELVRQRLRKRYGSL